MTTTRRKWWQWYGFTFGCVLLVFGFGDVGAGHGTYLPLMLFGAPLSIVPVIGVLAAPVLHLVYTRLLEMVETVNDGDPFVVENAARLQTIAWAIVGLEVMHVGVILLANGVIVQGQKVDIGEKFSVTPWLTILLLFVLARVFDQGARMRDELAATV